MGKRKGSGDKNAGSLTFVNVIHPRQIKDGRARSQIFSHAMRDHLRRQGSSKPRTANGQWSAASETNNAGRNDTGRDTGNHTVCMCRLGTAFACSYEPDVDFLLHVLSQPLSVDASDAFRSLFPSSSAPTVPQQTTRGGRDNKTSAGLIFQLCIRLAAALRSDVHTNVVQSPSLLHIRHHLTRALQRGLEILPNGDMDAVAIALIHLLYVDLWHGEIMSTTSHRAAANSLLEHEGGVSALTQRNPQVAYAFFTQLMLADVFLEQLTLHDLNVYSYQLSAISSNIAVSPFYWPHGSEHVLRNSPSCSSELLAVLKAVRGILANVLEREDDLQAQSLGQQLLRSSLLQNKTSATLVECTESERTGTVLRLVVIILTVAIINRTPLSESLQAAAVASGTPDILQMISASLESIKSGNLCERDDFMGVLLFVGLIVLPLTALSDHDDMSDGHLLLLRI